ncbi:uncharacterized protein LOC130820964 [Amaranthus tricolor]|uniref:uncharacterized protein LOC130820964 n=1 Tax=Amaranthus tricolor TaxID=29722 RepID=UPI002585F8CB|nr:uncharacterized protein LOC130820964 [Amaranthus tricolor]
MNHAIKLGRQSPIFSTPNSLSSIVSSRKGVDSVRFVQITGNNDPKQQPNLHNMDKSNKDQNLNAMEESFGEAYATRSDEEGFGGIYGGNDEDNAAMKIVQDTAHHDSSQGSEVKEKEKARNQTDSK